MNRNQPGDIGQTPANNRSAKIVMFANSITQLAHCCKIVRETKSDIEKHYHVYYLGSDIQTSLERNAKAIKDLSIEVIDVSPNWQEARVFGLPNYSVTKAIFLSLLFKISWFRKRLENTQDKSEPRDRNALCLSSHQKSFISNQDVERAVQSRYAETLPTHEGTIKVETEPAFRKAKFRRLYGNLRQRYLKTRTQLAISPFSRREVFSRLKHASFLDLVALGLAVFSLKIRPRLDSLISIFLPDYIWKIFPTLDGQREEISYFLKSLADFQQKHDIIIKPRYKRAICTEFLFRRRILESLPQKLGESGYEAAICVTCSAYQQSALFTRSCKLAGIRVYLMPFDRATVKEMEDWRRFAPRHHLTKKSEIRILQKVYPACLTKISNQFHCLNEFEGHIVDAMLGHEIPFPWAYNSVPNLQFIPRSREEIDWHYRECHIPADRTSAAIGYPIDEKIWGANRVSTTPKDTLSSSQKLCLAWSVSHDLFPSRGKLVDFHPDYHSLIEQMAKDLSNCGYLDRILASIHPRCTPMTKEILSRFPKVQIVDDIIVALRNSDFCLLECSSVALSALALGLCVIDYDIFKHELKCNSGLDGVIHFTKYDGFKRLFHEEKHIPSQVADGIERCRHFLETGYYGFANPNFGRDFDRILMPSRF